MKTEQPEAVKLVIIDWQRGKWSSAKGKYSREHTWLLAGGVKLRVSDSDAMVPEAYRDGVRLDPKKMFVATIASAHMLSWLHLAFAMGAEVASYQDEAAGVLSELDSDLHRVSEVILNPQITYNERSRATATAEARLYELAHEHCFIANSVKTKVMVRSP
jgi:organic hydroperoxide reductase OsmC/OhrA